MSYGTFVHVDRRQRLAAETARRASARTPAYSVIRHRFPEWVRDGQVDRFAVDALLQLWAEHGKGNVMSRMVRERREQLVQQHLQQRAEIGDADTRTAA